MVSNSTRSFSLNICVRLGGLWFHISLVAIRSAVVTSLWICSRYCTCSSTLCTHICRYSGGLKAGWKPYHILKGDWWVLRCGRALCANLIMGRRVAQLFCWKFLHICRYCSNSWLTHSDSPSVCGWKVVDNFCLISNFRQNSWVTCVASCGPQSEIIVNRKPITRATSKGWGRPIPGPRLRNPLETFEDYVHCGDKYHDSTMCPTTFTLERCTYCNSNRHSPTQCPSIIAQAFNYAPRVKATPIPIPPKPEEGAPTSSRYPERAIKPLPRRAREPRP
jgi:hypothetical protein